MSGRVAGSHFIFPNAPSRIRGLVFIKRRKIVALAMVLLEVGHTI